MARKYNCCLFKRFFCKLFGKKCKTKPLDENQISEQNTENEVKENKKIHNVNAYYDGQEQETKQEVLTESKNVDEECDNCEECKALENSTEAEEKEISCSECEENSKATEKETCEGCESNYEEKCDCDSCLLAEKESGMSSCDCDYCKISEFSDEKEIVVTEDNELEEDSDEYTFVNECACEDKYEEDSCKCEECSISDKECEQCNDCSTPIEECVCADCKKECSQCECDLCSTANECVECAECSEKPIVEEKVKKENNKKAKEELDDEEVEEDIDDDQISKSYVQGRSLYQYRRKTAFKKDEYYLVKFNTVDIKRYPIEVGILKVKNGRIVDQFESLIKLPRSVEKEEYYKNGYTKEMFKDAPTFPKLWPQIRKVFSKNSNVICTSSRVDTAAIRTITTKYNINVQAFMYSDAVDIFKTKLKIDSATLEDLYEMHNLKYEYVSALEEALSTKHFIDKYLREYPTIREMDEDLVEARTKIYNPDVTKTQYLKNMK